MGSCPHQSAASERPGRPSSTKYDGVLKRYTWVIPVRILRNQTDLVAENLALRRQLAILTARKRTPRLWMRDRIFCVWLSRLWAGWRSVLVIVQPDTVVRWHRRGFKLCWRWKSRTGTVGRPKIDAEIRKLIRCMSRDNPLWGALSLESTLSGVLAWPTTAVALSWTTPTPRGIFLILTARGACSRDHRVLKLETAT